MIVVYDVTRRDSFDKVDEWVSEVKKYGNDNNSFCLVGNKCDIVNKEISTEEGKNKAKEIGASFFEASAKTGENVVNIFNSMSD